MNNGKAISVISREVKPNGEKPKNVQQMGLKKLMKNFGPLENVKIFTGNASLPLAKNICRILNLSIGKADVGRHHNGEQFVRINESVRGQTCFVIQSICRSKSPGNKGWNSPADNFMELAFIVDALQRAWAQDVIVGIPYYGFSKQERKKGRESISAELIARFLQTIDIRGGFAFTLHSPAIAGFFKCPFDDIPLLSVFIRLIKKNGLLDEKIKIAAIDSGGVNRAHPVANKTSLDLVVSHKHRDPRQPDKAETIAFAGDVKDYLAIIIEDMIQRGTTFIRGTEALKESGAKGVFFFGTHADICGDKIINYIRTEPFIKKVFLANTTQLVYDFEGIDKVEIIPVEGIIAENIYRNVKKLPCTKFFVWD